MTVKALCGVIYNGVLHPAGETFNADTLLPNTEQIIINEHKAPESAEPPVEETTSEPNRAEEAEKMDERPKTPDFSGLLNDGKSKKRR